MKNRWEKTRYKSCKEVKVGTPEAVAQSNKVWKNNSFKWWIDLSFPSKVCVFLSPHIPHIRQYGIILQITVVLCLLNTTWHDPMRPNNEHTIFHNSWAIGPCMSKWSIVSPFCLRIQRQSTTTTCRLRKLSTVKIYPNTAVQMKLTSVGIFSFHNGFHGENNGLVGFSAQ